ncbi:DUF4139 domain-containing protein [Myroides marinus]|uniref:DUF4139 domain-containing protein n=1 Tax=Myroides marinus TaxID=703342 RepID=UPI002578CA66|nr:DUF4139 domain-containing protein [Myroides marinus]MDM1368793.1 DUF4139 domain-containing protein [Myroides marinus]MDM1371086.1 DUF4139 domain-containing protein [Myroides marinus]MDM1374134.1 DUF4139 domain-containing protein [Myroides marinus]MDM1382600.1 DUF4139 domain-containing protein [Myroides marinus]MDM1388607.1 DUF4139 domain-containing protein [Myroides marinus]
MKKNLTIVALALCSVVTWGQKPVFTQASLESARVYFNSAELTHKAKVKLPKGTSELVITNVADYLNESSIQIGSISDVTVMSIQYSNRYVEEYDSAVDSPLIKPVKDSIKLIKAEIKKLSNALNVENKTIDLLDKNQNVGGENGTTTAEVMKMVDYYKTKRLQLVTEVDKLTEKKEVLEIKLSNLESKLAFNEGKDEKASKGKLIIQVMNDKEGDVPFQIKYLTQSASWKPFYDLRVDKINSPVKVVYKADVKQNSGIDWRGVNLSLTSGVANQSNVIPTWRTWFLDYRNVNYGQYGKAVGIGAKKISPSAMLDVSDSYETKDYAKSDKSVVYETKNISDYTQVNESQLNVSFDISIPYTILSNGKSHSVSLNDFSIPAEYKYYVAPKLDLNAYLVATITDYGNYNLLAGEANVIFDGVYVGKTILNPANTEEEMKLNMGKDPKVTVTRTLMKDKSGTKVLSSKKTQNFVYDITVRNNKSEQVVIQVEDQYPLSNNTSIEIELTDTSSGVVDTEKGLVKWDLKLKANETKTLRFGYQVRSDKNQNLNL